MLTDDLVGFVVKKRKKWKKWKNDRQLQLLEQIALPELPHEQNCSAWAPNNRIVLPELPHEQYSLHPGSGRPGKVRRVFSIFSIFSNIFRHAFTVKTQEYLKKLFKMRPVWRLSWARFYCKNTGNGGRESFKNTIWIGVVFQIFIWISIWILQKSSHTYLKKMKKLKKWKHKGVSVGKDYTIFATQNGVVKFESDKKDKIISLY